MDGIEYLGLVASSFGTFAFLPQVLKTWRTRSAHDFSLVTLVMLEAGTGLWVVYGVWRDAPAIWIGNGVTLLLAGFILSVKMRGAACRPPQERSSAPVRRFPICRSILISWFPSRARSDGGCSSTALPKAK